MLAAGEPYHPLIVAHPLHADVCNGSRSIHSGISGGVCDCTKLTLIYTASAVCHDARGLSTVMYLEVCL